MGTELLGKAGIRSTQAREQVLQVLNKAGRPLSHQEIGQRLKKKSLDRVTIYRTLMTLQKAELLHRIQGTDGIWRFSAHAAGAKHKCGGDHVHFLCSGCNKMSCLPEQPLPWISPPSGAKIHGKQLLVYGRCPACAAKEKR